MNMLGGMDRFVINVFICSRLFRFFCLHVYVNIADQNFMQASTSNKVRHILTSAIDSNIGVHKKVQYLSLSNLYQ